MPSMIARRASHIVDLVEDTDLEHPTAMRELTSDEFVGQVLAELAARRMLKPATKWPGRS